MIRFYIFILFFTLISCTPKVNNLNSLIEKFPEENDLNFIIEKYSLKRKNSNTFLINDCEINLLVDKEKIVERIYIPFHEKCNFKFFQLMEIDSSNISIESIVKSMHELNLYPSFKYDCPEIGSCGNSTEYGNAYVFFSGTHALNFEEIAFSFNEEIGNYEIEQIFTFLFAEIDEKNKKELTNEQIEILQNFKKDENFHKNIKFKPDGIYIGKYSNLGQQRDISN